ncbi:MAG TPA: phage holin family protein [Pseudonocardiaceae bacterium]
MNSTTAAASTARTTAGGPSGSSEPAEASTADLVGALSDQASTLIRAELRLAAAELKDKGRQAGVGGGMIGGGAAVAFLGAGTLVAAAVLGLATVLPAWLSALLVGLVLMLAAGALAMVGLARLRGAAPPIPEQAIDSGRQDIQTVKASVRR